MIRQGRSIFRRGQRRSRSAFATRKYRLLRRYRDMTREISTAAAALVVVALLGLVSIFLCNYALSSPLFRIREVTVRGCRELTEKDILTLAAIKPTSTLLSINTDTLRRRITANPWVKEVFVGREFPDRLVMEVRERKALALLERPDGFYLMDAEGVPFKKLASDDDVDIPVLTGCHSGAVAQEKLLPKALALLQCLAAQTFPIGGIAEIHGDETFGLSLFTSAGLCLQLGFDSYENKLKRLQTVMVDLERQDLNGAFLQIDLCDPTKITIQKKAVAAPAQRRASAKETRIL
jgi:cell division protein FtsQ